MQLKQLYHLNISLNLTCFIVPRIFSREQCQQLVKKYTGNGFDDAIHNYPTYYRNNQRLVVDDRNLADMLLQRVKPYLPAQISVTTGRTAKQCGLWALEGLNPKFRFCRYTANQYFGRHLDGIHHSSTTVQSKLTFMVYLNSLGLDFLGGRTLFYQHHLSKGIIGEYSPVQGDLIVFDHQLWHEGEAVTQGQKFVMRSDILYCKKNTAASRVLQKKQQNFEQGHEGYIWSLLHWSKDMVLSGGRDKLIKVWNQQGECVSRLVGHQNSVLAMIKLNEDTLVSCSRDKNINVWKLEDGQFSLVRRWIAHGGSTVLRLARLYDNSFASGGADFMIKIWRLPQYEEVGILKGHQDWVFKIVTIDSQFIASCSEDTVRIWEMRTGRQVGQYRHRSALHAMVFYPAGHLYLGDVEGNIIHLKLTKNKDTSNYSIQLLLEIQAHQTNIRCLEIIDESTIASGGEDDLIKIWRVADNSLQLQNSFKHGNFVTNIIQSHTQTHILSSSYDGSICKHPVHPDKQ